MEGSNASLLKIVNQDLNYTNMEACEVGLDYTDFSMVKAGRGRRRIDGATGCRKGIGMMTYIDPVITSLLGDPVRVTDSSQSISNAAKFTEKGEILIRATRESYDKESVLVRIAVIDTGSGIEEEKLKEYFERQLPNDIGGDGDSDRDYEPGERFTELQQSNSGLGLAISKQLVDMMGGQIGATSIPEKGSTFWFSIRFRKEDRSEK
ncbi:MAG: ATP-binding protein [Cyanobacteriota/Melainabacteria group bacterium]